MTHKNPALRAQPAPVPKAPANAATAGKRPTLPRKPESLMAKKPSKFVLEGNKWLIEYQDGETLTVDETDRNHTINLFGCKNTTVIVKGKVNAVTLGQCSWSRTNEVAWLIVCIH
jgi:adenylyl cyclase-associated protein